jgi:hypothetical protein
MKEVWKDVEGFEGLYQVSNIGRIKSFVKSNRYHDAERILNPTIRNGYKYVFLCNNRKNRTTKGKHYLVHRLVAKAFVINPKPDDFCYVNHKDENKLNNRFDNLEWCDIKYNNTYGTGSLRQSISLGRHVEQITSSGIPIARYYSLSIASELTGINKHSIERCCNNERKHAGGFAWRYVE